MAWALAKNNKVLFVEPPFTILSPLRDRNISWKQLFNLGRLKHQGRNIYSYSPFKLLPLSLPFFERFDFDALNKKIIFYQLKKNAKRLNIKNPILWVFFSDKQYEYYGLFDETFIIGDLYDKFTVPTWEGMPAVHIQHLQQLQDTIINKTDIIFTVSQPLYNEFKLLHNKVYLVPNGVDYESFEDQCGADCGVDTLKKLRKPILGYLGMMHYKVDFHLLDSIAENHPKWTLLLMGKDNIHVNEDRKIFNKLLKRENVIWCKEITRTAIPCFLDAVDVCIVPLKKLDMNRYANYLKIWEYLAAGKPIVAINQDADLGAAKHFISVVDDKHGFERAIENVLSESDEEGDKLKKARIAFAKSNTWDHRVEQMMGVIDKFLKEKPERYN